MKFIARFERTEYKWCEIEIEAESEEDAEEQAGEMDVSDDEWTTENAYQDHTVTAAEEEAEEVEDRA